MKVKVYFESRNQTEHTVCCNSLIKKLFLLVLPSFSGTFCVNVTVPGSLMAETRTSTWPPDLHLVALIHVPCSLVRSEVLNTRCEVMFVMWEPWDQNLNWQLCLLFLLWGTQERFYNTSMTTRRSLVPGVGEVIKSFHTLTSHMVYLLVPQAEKNRHFELKLQQNEATQSQQAASTLAQSANVQNNNVYIDAAPARVMWYKPTNHQKPTDLRNIVTIYTDIYIV